uniref:Uncharacterized protein n=1 Tax=Dictyoglomus turgidum TaxID=513050 RepID=A0A7C3SN80_9BACT
MVIKPSRKVEKEKMNVKLELLEPMLGTAPKDKGLYARFVGDKAPDGRGEEELEDIKCGVGAENAGWTIFRGDEFGLYVPDFMIKGFLKSAAIALKSQFNLGQPKAKIDRLVFVYPRKIRLIDGNGNVKKEPDGVIERSLRAETMKGDRIALARSDYVNPGLILEFDIVLLKNKEIKLEDIVFWLNYGEELGLGQWRNGGWGRFKVIKAETVD